MKEINRFYIMGNKLPSDDGSIVSYKDHAAIVAEKDARIAELESTNKSVTENYLRVSGERNEALYKVIEFHEQVRALAAENIEMKKFCKNAAFDADYEAEIGMDRGGFTDALNGIKTPATDADLREIRAQAVESFMSWSDSHIEEGDEYERQLRYVSSACKVFAARIRSGEQP